MKYTAYVKVFQSGVVHNFRYPNIEAETEAAAEERVRRANTERKFTILAIRVVPYDENYPEFHNEDPQMFLFDQEWEKENAPAIIADETRRCARALEKLCEQTQGNQVNTTGGVRFATMLVSLLSVLLQLGLLILLLIRM